MVNRKIYCADGVALLNLWGVGVKNGR